MAAAATTGLRKECLELDVDTSVEQSGRTESMPVVLIWDPIRALSWNYDIERTTLAAAGVRLIVPEGALATEDELRSAQVLVVASKMPSEVLDSLVNCIGIVCYSVGMDNVDLERATQLGIPVTNVAGYCTEEVSDHAIALTLALQRRIVTFSNATAAGEWNVYSSDAFRSLRRIRGQVIGIIGLGRIGTKVAEKAHALGMTVNAYDPYVTASGHAFVTLVSLDHLIESSDAIVLCSALTDGARHLIDDKRLMQMRRGVLLINVARGGLIDERALASALASGHVAAAALDVRETEPPDEMGDPLKGLPNVIVTPHVAATSQESRLDLHRMASERALELLAAASLLEVHPA